MIQGIEWIFVSAFVLVQLVGLIAIFAIQGDMWVKLVRDMNSDEKAVEIYVRLISNAKKSVTIFDDGDDSSKSVYNSEDVISAIRAQIEKYPKLKIRCLFNDKNDDIRLAQLADDEFSENVEIWYSGTPREVNETHYKIVDGGKMVHLSAHRFKEIERAFTLRTVPWFAIGTAGKIASPWLSHFERNRSLADSRRP